MLNAVPATSIIAIATVVIIVLLSYILFNFVLTMYNYNDHRVSATIGYEYNRSL